MKFLLLVAIAVSIASVESNPLPHPLKLLVPVDPDYGVVRAARRDAASDPAGVASRSHLAKRGIWDMISQFFHDVPMGYLSDMAVGGKLMGSKVLDDLGKRSIREGHRLEKRNIFYDLFNMLVGNIEGAVTGMDII
nr:uncharacterized protein LOC117221513 [Megalopta genalis]